MFPGVNSQKEMELQTFFEYYDLNVETNYLTPWN
jgi:hypothetical protein